MFDTSMGQTFQSAHDSSADSFYRRRLPHWQPTGGMIFLNWRLYGSLPNEALERLASEKCLLEKQPVQPGESSRDRALRQSKRLFGLGEKQSRKPAPPAEETEQAGKPAPRVVPLRRITHSLKGYTAREANRLLQRTGLPFWQDESYDHWARNEAEIEQIAAYIESDPVRSGLVAHPLEWRWSSACERERDRMQMEGGT